MIWAFIGIIVGIVLGITGAGGAIVSVPMFIHFCGTTLHQATAYALISVFAGASLNAYFQRKLAFIKLSLLLALFSLGGSILFTPIKAQTSDVAIKTLFISVCLYGIWNIWKPSPKNRNKPQLLDKHFQFIGMNLFKVGMGGVFLGALITLTGLGGGVILVPFLSGVMGLSVTSAVATSLFTVALSSLGSLFLQREFVGREIGFSEVALLFTGTLVSAWLISIILQKKPPPWLSQFRKWALTALIMLSILGLLK